MSQVRTVVVVLLVTALASGFYVVRRSRVPANSTSGEVSTPRDSLRCVASASSMTPSHWVAAPVNSPRSLRRRLQTIATIPLPGPANRYDYQSIDTISHRLYINHMNSGRLTVFDLQSNKVVGDIGGMDRATGVLAVPDEHRVYVSAAGRHELMAVDDRSLEIEAAVKGIRFPDGIAYAPAERKIFVSDEAGSADVAIDAAGMIKLATIDLGGEAGNTHYDSVSHCIVVTVQTRNQLVAIDPVTDRIAARYDIPGSDEPHGFVIDEAGRLAFVTGEGNATLQVVDLRTMRVLASHQVGKGPDVVAWDPAWRLVYVASEEGVVTVFEVIGSKLRQLDEVRAPHAHTVAVDPQTHRVYLPLQNVGGHPVLQIMQISAR